MSWNDKPYKGGGPAKVKGFPRPLYPPDVPPSSGHEPSKKGPDVLAYKRTVCRLGRWGDWNPAGWDEGYWTDFAHGKEVTNVSTAEKIKRSGVAGVQWQQHLDATGWLGKQTFDALRYALVPAEFPHGGEQAMDSVACDLIDEAWEMFQGHPPPAAGSTRLAALELLRGELGYKESPSGSNQNKYGAWYGMNGQPWCAMAATWAYEHVPGGSPSFVKGSRYAYCPYIVADARGGKYGLKTTDDPSPGDLVVYDWSYDTVYDHVGLFEKWVGPSTFQAIEGNTSTSNNSNGGEVMRRTRSLGDASIVFVRVAEP